MIAGYFVTQFAQAYGQGSYGNCTYNATTCASSGSGSSGGQLTNTGVIIAGFVALACLIIFASLLVRFWRRKPQQKPLAEEADESTEDDDPTGE